MILTVFFYIFVAVTGIQIIYYIVFSSILFKSKKKKLTEEQPPVSVIILVKNNATIIEEKLPFILAQNYVKFEVVVINNASTDNTLDSLEQFSQNHSNLKIVNVENNEVFWGNKKYALTLGIKAAKYENLFFTDVKSEPLSEFWLATMSKHLRGKKTIILGYSKYQKQGSLSNLIIRFENLLTAIKNFTFSKFGNPFTAFGDNFAYSKTDFFKVKGFINHMKLHFGEHDLFLKDAANHKNVGFTIAENSFVEKEIPASFGEWFHEQRKKSSLKKHYKFKHRFLLSLFTLSKLCFFILGALLFFFYSWQILSAIVLTYYLVQFIIIGIAAKKLKEPYLIFALPFLEIGLLLIQITIFMVNLISKPNHWK